MNASARIAAAALLVVGCIYDPDHPCGANQLYRDGECICVEGAAQNAYLTACVPCGPNEVGAGKTCTCRAGFIRSRSTGACEPVSAALGSACDPDGAGCSDPVYSTCYVPRVETPYCTQSGCTSNAACGGGYACDTRQTPSVCVKLPTGVGETCASDADCAAFEAKHCETYLLKTCLVKDCGSPEVTCFAGSVCCDYSVILLPLSVCIQPENLDQGRCPVGGVLVSE